VELAQLRYLLPAERGQWGHCSRQPAASANGAFGGRTQLEIDPPAWSVAASAPLAEDLARIETERGEQRKRRRAEPRVALVGYTNAGKSTILNLMDPAAGTFRGGSPLRHRSNRRPPLRPAAGPARRFS